MRIVLPATLLTTLALVAGSPVRAADPPAGCTGVITSLPVAITTQGVWCLANDLATTITSGAAINVAANNVTIACNGFKLGNLSAGPATVAYGVYSANRTNTVVRGCSLRGFHVGVFVTGSGGGTVVEDNRLDGSTYVGLLVYSPNSTVRGNLVHDTGGSPASAGASAGILVSLGVDVLENTVSGVVPGHANGQVAGILSSANPGATLSRNRISGLAPGGGAAAWGIRDTSTNPQDRVLIVDNLLNGPDTPLSDGARCGSNFSMTTRNAIQGFAKAVVTCQANDDHVNPN